MKIDDAAIGLEVVRAKGDYVVGQISVITDIDLIKNRIKTTQDYWVKIECFEPTFIEYEIIPSTFCKKKGRIIYPKYKVK